MEYYQLVSLYFVRFFIGSILVVGVFFFLQDALDILIILAFGFYIP